jgi:hypothetical protein
VRLVARIPDLCLEPLLLHRQLGLRELVVLRVVAQVNRELHQLAALLLLGEQHDVPAVVQRVLTLHERDVERDVPGAIRSGEQVLVGHGAGDEVVPLVAIRKMARAGGLGRRPAGAARRREGEALS